jgi:hypothetical protein
MVIGDMRNPIVMKAHQEQIQSPSNEFKSTQLERRPPRAGGPGVQGISPGRMHVRPASIVRISVHTGYVSRAMEMQENDAGASGDFPDMDRAAHSET